MTFLFNGFLFFAHTFWTDTDKSLLRFSCARAAALRKSSKR